MKKEDIEFLLDENTALSIVTATGIIIDLNKRNRIIDIDYENEIIIVGQLNSNSVLVIGFEEVVQFKLAKKD